MAPAVEVPSLRQDSAQEKPALPKPELHSQPVLFVGDVMLGRNVEREIVAHGIEYPFSNLHDFLAKYTYVVGNFEASMPHVHQPTPSMGFQFSITKDIAESLKSHGFTHMTLANNHAYDFGREGYAHAHEVLEASGLSVGGSPDQITLHDVLFIDAQGLRIALIPIYAVFATPDHQALKEAFTYAASSSDVQIAFIHWGTEYISKNNARQEHLAQEVIDLGADAVIGHHPHVIENISVYHRVPIFYSLGNFIFDQYWNMQVKTGLTIGVERKGEQIQYSLQPFFSERSNPKPLEGEEKTLVLKDLAATSDPSLREAIINGSITVPYDFLASKAQ